MTEDISDIPTQEIEIKAKQESISEQSSVIEKFKVGDLLVRVMDPPRIARGENGFEIEIDSWKDELGFMGQEGGMPHASTTMIMDRKAIPLYHKPFGLLIDAKKVVVEHVSSHDSGSVTTNTGELWASQSDVRNLEELKSYYGDKLGIQEMNEVNVTLKKGDLVGVVIKKGVTSPSTLAGLEVVRKFLKENDLSLPIFEYDERKGEMSKFETPDKSKVLSALKPEFQLIYQKALL